MTSKTTFALKSQAVSRTNVGAMSRGASTTRLGPKSRGASTTRMAPLSRGVSTTNMGLKSAMASRTKLGARKRPAKKPGILNALRYQMKELFTPGFILYLSAVVCAILVFIILWIGLLYHQKLKRANVQVAAINRMLDYAGMLQPSLKEKNDTEKMLHLQKLADILAVWTLKTMELENAIVDITRKLQLRWEQYNEAIYLFEERAMTWYAAKEACESYQAALVSVEDEEEEEFLESKAQNAHQDYWIGLYWLDTWKWADGSNAEKNHWATNKPKDSMKNPCAVLPTKCRTSQKCWINIRCGENRRLICKKKPDKRWFS
ncbi:C-type lectin domain family 4 member K-like [Anolis carolinensis]|uniref:C-type lectin domain family 4 member K-like n=1 Tax=Anolis carolinensis TaxID=28377 RepID=UPI002F2B7FE9